VSEGQHTGSVMNAAMVNEQTPGRAESKPAVAAQKIVGWKVRMKDR